MCCCLWSDLDSFILGGRTQGLVSSNDTSSFIGYRECEGFTSTKARRLQSTISMLLPSCDDSDNQFNGNNQDANESSESSTIRMIMDVSIAKMKSDNLLFL